MVNLGHSHTVWKSPFLFLLLCLHSALYQPFGRDPRHGHMRSLPFQERSDPLWCFQIEGPCLTVGMLFGVATSKPYFKDTRALGLRFRVLDAAL